MSASALTGEVENFFIAPNRTEPCDSNHLIPSAILYALCTIALHTDVVKKSHVLENLTDELFPLNHGRLTTSIFVVLTAFEALGRTGGTTFRLDEGLCLVFLGLYARSCILLHSYLRRPTLAVHFFTALEGDLPTAIVFM